ncbi:MAG TPA: peptide-methionine (S)-S-oxide reductase, partial [Salinibacter sp.]|nr:peptide-methionine (S)-S-oxide reductase [Salinibacter sp.]
MDRDVPPDTILATFALGCFWRPDALFGALDGVVRTRVGYAGGTTATPSYDDIGDHIEAVQVEYDPSALDYDR